jgi:ComF family protein
LLKIFGQFILKLKNICFPITCCNCEKIVDSEGLCLECWKKIKWIDDPKCRICGAPFEIDVEALCLQCIKKKPHFDQAISVFEYDNFSKSVILKFKHGDATHICRQLVVWLWRASQDVIKDFDIIVPVSIHFLKRLKRKYNQSELLAQKLGILSGISYEPRILRKEKQTPQQEGLSRNARLKNVRNSFEINLQYAHLLRNKNVILVDDVLTTGATVNECSHNLKKHGAKKVIVLTVARVSA